MKVKVSDFGLLAKAKFNVPDGYSLSISISIFLSKAHFCVFPGASDSEIVDPAMEEAGDSLKASDSEEEPAMEEAGDSLKASDSEEEPSDSEEEEPDSEQSGTTSPHSLNQNTSGGMQKLSYIS